MPPGFQLSKVAMRIMIQALVEDSKGEEPRMETIRIVERDIDRTPASGLGLFLRESSAMPSKVKAVVLR